MCYSKHGPPASSACTASHFRNGSLACRYNQGPSATLVTNNCSDAADMLPGNDLSLGDLLEADLDTLLDTFLQDPIEQDLWNDCAFSFPQDLAALPRSSLATAGQQLGNTNIWQQAVPNTGNSDNFSHPQANTVPGVAQTGPAAAAAGPSITPPPQPVLRPLCLPRSRRSPPGPPICQAQQRQPKGQFQPHLADSPDRHQQLQPQPTATLLKRYWQLRQLDEQGASQAGHGIQTGPAGTQAQQLASGSCSMQPSAAARPIMLPPASEMPAPVGHLPTSQPQAEIVLAHQGCNPFPTVPASPQISQQHQPGTPQQAGRPPLPPSAAALLSSQLPGRSSHTNCLKRSQCQADVMKAARPACLLHSGQAGPVLGMHTDLRPSQAHHGVQAERIQGRQVKRARVEAKEHKRGGTQHSSCFNERIVSLEQQNAALSQEIGILRDTLHLWCIQGTVSPDQALEFLAHLASTRIQPKCFTSA